MQKKKKKKKSPWKSCHEKCVSMKFLSWKMCFHEIIVMKNVFLKNNYFMHEKVVSWKIFFWNNYFMLLFSWKSCHEKCVPEQLFHAIGTVISWSYKFFMTTFSWKHIFHEQNFHAWNNCSKHIFRMKYLILTQISW